MYSNTMSKRIKITPPQVYNPQVPTPMQTPPSYPVSQLADMASLHDHEYYTAAPPVVFPRPEPNQETQELYNAYRKAQMEHGEEATHGQANGRGRLLTPQSGMPMSRSPSYTSCESLSNNMGEFGLQNSTAASGENRDVGLPKPTAGPGQKRKAGRQGPLNECTKARAALVRKLGACPDCKARKVKCTHHDISRFEVAYQADQRRRQERQYEFCHTFIPPELPPAAVSPLSMPATPAMATRAAHVATPPPHTTPIAGNGRFDRLGRDLVLLGIGGDSTRHLNVPETEANADLDHILAQSRIQLPISPVSPRVLTTPVVPATTSTLSRWLQKKDRPQPRPQQNTQPRQSPTTIVSPPIVSIPAAPDNANLGVDIAIGTKSGIGSVLSPDIPIGRLLSPASAGIWECQGTTMTTGRPSISDRARSVVSLSETCASRFPSLDLLQTHFKSMHGDFLPLEPPYLYKCLKCGFLNDTQDRLACLFCDDPGRHREKWHYGSVAGSQASRSEFQVPVGASDGGATFPFTFSPVDGPTGSGGGGGGGGGGAATSFSGFHSGAGGGGQGHGWARGGSSRNEPKLIDDEEEEEGEPYDCGGGFGIKWEDDMLLKKTHCRLWPSSPLAVLLALAATRRLLLPFMLVLSFSAVAVLESRPLLEHHLDIYHNATVPSRWYDLPAAASAIIGALFGVALVSWLLSHARPWLLRASASSMAVDRNPLGVRII